MTPPIDPQIAVLIANMRNLVGQFDRMLASQDRIERSIAEVPLLRRDYEHLIENFKQLQELAEERAAVSHQLDKRVLVLERWHRFMVAQPAAILTIVLAAWGYWHGFTTGYDDFKGSTKERVQALEFIVNSPNFQRAIAPDDHPTATGPK